MSRYPCSYHGHRIAGKLGTAYWAWFRPDDVRTCYRQRLCGDCAKELIGPLLALLAAPIEDVFDCALCHSKADEGIDPMFLTMYAPKAEPLEITIPACPSCAARLQLEAQKGADHMEDRGAAVGGPQPPMKDPPGWGWASAEPAEVLP